jgi:hypothetical protein
LPKTSRAELEAQLIVAHAQLQLIPRGTVARVATLMRHGSFEVRVLQPSHSLPESAVRYWIELFDHDRKLSIDSIGNCGLDKAVIATEDFIARAKRLSENPHSWRGST